MNKLNCKICDKTFEVKPYRKDIAKYCSPKCYLYFGQIGKKAWNKDIKTGLIPKTAFKKGEHFSYLTEFKRGNIPKHHFAKGNIPWNKGLIRSDIVGSRHWAWKGGITPDNVKVRNSVEYKQWRTSVFERDNYTCRYCNQRGGTLNADHIKEFAYYPGLRFSLDNGQTLCLSCHKSKGTYKGINYATQIRS